MSDGGNNLNLVPVFIQAKTKEELIKKMFLNNFINSVKFNYMSPLKEGKNWIVWYYCDVKSHKHIDKVKMPDGISLDGILNGTNK